MAVLAKNFMVYKTKKLLYALMYAYKCIFYGHKLISCSYQLYITSLLIRTRTFQKKIAGQRWNFFGPFLNILVILTVSLQLLMVFKWVSFTPQRKIAWSRQKTSIEVPKCIFLIFAFLKEYNFFFTWTLRLLAHWYTLKVDL